MRLQQQKISEIIQILLIVAYFTLLPSQQGIVVVHQVDAFSLLGGGGGGGGGQNGRIMIIPRYHGKNVDGILQSSSMFEYEYIPPDNNNKNQGGQGQQYSHLQSVYPPGTPAGMRGEAVRAALRSTQCIAWRLDATTSSSSSEQHVSQQNPLASGLLKLEGKGVLDFLNNKLSNSFLPSTESAADNNNNTNKNNLFKRACLLTSKGRLVDTLAIGLYDDDTKAFVLPSPGHFSSSLFQKLDPFIFPMDQVKLTKVSSCFIFTLASTNLQHVTDAVENHLLPKLQTLIPTTLDQFELPNTKDQCSILNLLGRDENDDCCLVVLPHTGLPDCAVVGYTFAFCCSGGAGMEDVGNQIWEHMIGDNNPKGPVEIKALEYDTLRIEAGQPAYGYEVTGAWKDPIITSPTPLELSSSLGQTSDIIDTDKGCYLGQEGIASILKNVRGPPRNLYTVIFDDDDNTYEYQSEDKIIDNKTTIPKVGDKIYVLGSNEEIQVGTLTSVAEPNSTGDTTIVALALIRRSDSILKQMKSKDLQIPRSLASKLQQQDASASAYSSSSSSGILPPPPRDSLDGLEIIVGGTYTVGMLRGVPSRRFPRGQNMYVDQEQILTKEEILDQGYVDIEFSGMSPTEFLEEKTAEVVVEEEQQQQQEEDEEVSPAAASDAGVTVEAAETTTDEAAAAAEAEAKRKAAKMELLKQRAEEAMARRRKKKLEMQDDKNKSSDNNNDDESSLAEDPAEAERKRKAEKMKLLEQRAAEAIARRRKKKKESQG